MYNTDLTFKKIIGYTLMLGYGTIFTIYKAIFGKPLYSEQLYITDNTIKLDEVELDNFSKK